MYKNCLCCAVYIPLQIFIEVLLAFSSNTTVIKIIEKWIESGCFLLFFFQILFNNNGNMGVNHLQV